MCVCFRLKSNDFEVRFNSFLLKPESPTALCVSVESPISCQKGNMKCHKDDCSSFHLQAYCLWHSLYYLIILCLRRPNTKDKVTLSLSLFFLQIWRSDHHDLLSATITQLGACMCLLLTVVREKHPRCLPEQFLANYDPQVKFCSLPFLAKLYWHTTTPICSLIISDCFHAITTELISCRGECISHKD